MWWAGRGVVLDGDGGLPVGRAAGRWAVRHVCNTQKVLPQSPAGANCAAELGGCDALWQGAWRVHACVVCGH